MQTEPATLNTFPCNPKNWVVNYADYLYNYAVTRINDDELARDLVQETFLAALEKVEKFEGRSKEGTWLTAILRNKIIDVYRKKSASLLKQEISEAEDYNAQDFFSTKMMAIGIKIIAQKPLVLRILMSLERKNLIRYFNFVSTNYLPYGYRFLL